MSAPTNPVRRPRTRQQPLCFVGFPRCARGNIGRVLAVWENTWSLRGDYDQFSQTQLSPAQIARLQEQGWWFTFVRNPWARVVSAWRLFEQPAFRAAGGRLRTLAEVLQLADIDWTARGWPAAVEPGEQELCGTDESLRAYLCPCSAGPLDKLHFVGQVEAAVADWETVQDCTGIRVALPAGSKARPDAYRQYFSAAERAVAARIYREDIERFDYSF